jgi:hypothetical protein
MEYDDFEDEFLNDDPYAEGERLKVSDEMRKVLKFELPTPISSLDNRKKHEFCVVIEELVLLDYDQEVCTIPPYNRQQIILSEIPGELAAKHEITNIVFPPVGAEILTQKYFDKIAWHVERVRAGRHFNVMAYGCREVDEGTDECVVFDVYFGVARRSFLWYHTRLRRIANLYPCEMRVKDGIFYNYTTNYSMAGFIEKEPLRFTKFERGKSYYIYIDGIPMYMPASHYAVVRVEDRVGWSCDNKKICNVDAEDGTYLIDVGDCRVVRSIDKRADSYQQIQIIKSKVITTDLLLDRYPYLEGRGSPIPYPYKVEIVPEIDTTSYNCQIIGHDVSELDNRKKNTVAMLSMRSLDLMVMGLSYTGVYIGNTRYSGYLGTVSNDVGMYQRFAYQKARTRGRILVIRGARPHHINCTWYEILSQDALQRLTSHASDGDEEDEDEHSETPGLGGLYYGDDYIMHRNTNGFDDVINPRSSV